MALHADLIGIGRHATNEVVAVLHLNEDHLGEILWHPGQFFVGCDQLPPRLWSMSSVLPPVTGNVSARRTRSTVNSAIAAANAAASNAAAANPSAKAALPICQTLGRSASGTVPTMPGMSPDSHVLGEFRRRLGVEPGRDTAGNEAARSDLRPHGTECGDPDQQADKPRRSGEARSHAGALRRDRALARATSSDSLC